VNEEDLNKRDKRDVKIIFSLVAAAIVFALILFVI
jgi:hypothetical protein